MISNAHGGFLDELAVDAVHRIITDQSRITQAWIDEFNRALGLPLETLPEPLPGEPDEYRPALAGIVATLSSSIQKELDLGRFHSAQNTPRLNLLQKLLGTPVRAIARFIGKVTR